ncbi:lengsin-like isoform X1 [Salvelinus alpinus]|uniref:lengsin-like isoform X1 n=2 Tax=Salvelinus alpinus TaxID=8036 RepID=UPI0039FC3110
MSIKGMHDSEDLVLEEGSIRLRDQVDGSGMSLGKKKGVKVSGKHVAPVDWDRGGPSIVHHSDYVSSPRPSESNPTIISIGPSPHSHRPSMSPERARPRQDEGPPSRVEWSREGCTYSPKGEVGVSRQTMDELKSILKDSSMLGARGKEEGGRPGSPAPYTYLHGTNRGDGRPESQSSFTTFKPHSDASRRVSTRSRDSSSIQLGSGMDSSTSHRSDVTGANRQSEVRSSTFESSSANCGDNSKDNMDKSGTRSFVSTMEHIKQQIARENINFVRFEATDLHGVSRSKTVPVRFFHEKAVYGVPMPRSYLELTLSPKSCEVDHANNPANFSSDVLLIPDLSTFRVLPWAEQTARVICDPCMITGSPLRTAPRLIAKQLMGQLQSMGFSLYSSFTYECCVLGAPDRVGPKSMLFPATTLASNHDLPFFQQLVNGMYCMGADVDSLASAMVPGQMEINLRPEFGIAAADTAFTFRTGIKEMARKYSYIASFFTDDSLYNAGVLSHSLWDANSHRSLFHTGDHGTGELSEIGRKWLAGLLSHSAALSCLLSPGLGCRSHIAKKVKDPKHNVLYATYGYNDNSSAFNVKCHGGRETHIDNKLGSAMANPYVVLAATVAAGLDGIKRNLAAETGLTRASTHTQLGKQQFAIPVKLEDALVALSEDHVIRGALGEPFVQYFIALKQFEIETEELDTERNKCLEYFI